jgi:ATP synthase in type III secretion protein N
VNTIADSSVPARGPIREQLLQRLDGIELVTRIGRVVEIIVSTVKAAMPEVAMAELCRIQCSDGKSILGEVIAFSGNIATISCLESVSGITLGAAVYPLGKPHSVKTSVHDNTFRILDGMGRSLESPHSSHLGVLSTDRDATPVIRNAAPATSKPPVSEALLCHIRVIDNLITLGKGQRIGIFAPPGCGKSTLMAQIVRGAEVDAVVFGLVGERGRELREFVEKEITDDIRSRSYFVCATSDKTPIERVRAAFTAMSIAEHLRDQGKSVLLLIDSITRLARAQREIGLMAGEPTTRAGFTPSVYKIMPELIERAGLSETGCITAIYTVLMETDNIEDDPIASEAKSLLDGHIILNPKLVHANHFPAIDVLKILSRVMSSVVPAKTQELASLARRVYSIYSDIELLLRLNEYKVGSDPLTDEAIRLKPQLDTWCKQSTQLKVNSAESFKELKNLLDKFSMLV